MEIKNDEILQDSMLLDLEIIKSIHEIQKIKNEFVLYKIKNEYCKELEKLKSLLKKQYKINKKNYSINITKVPEINEEIAKEIYSTKMYGMLSKEEQEFITSYNYDYKRDKLNLLNNRKSPDVKIVREWNMLRFNLLSIKLENSKH